jgi:hypothetical protein
MQQAFCDLLLAPLRIGHLELSLSPRDLVAARNPCGPEGKLDELSWTNLEIIIIPVQAGS